MIVDLTAAALIRAGSGLLYVALGTSIVILVARRPASERGLGFALALHAIGFGGTSVVFNIFRPEDRNDAIAVIAAHWSLAVLTLVGIAGVLFKLPRTRRTTAAALALWVATTVAFGYHAFVHEAAFAARAGFTAAPEIWRLDLVTLMAGRAGAIAVVLALALGSPPGKRLASLWLALALSLHAAYTIGTNGVADMRLAGPVWAGLVGSVGLVVVSAAWLAARERGAGRGAVGLALAIPLLVLVGALEIVLTREQTAFVGFLRIFGAISLSIAVVRHDLLSTGLVDLAVRRGTLATAAMAAIFVVAEIAQNFLSASYGLLMGGVVAGALLFAAAPIQRAMEARSLAVNGPSAGASEREASFRAAARMALKDGHITREEERQLVVLADHLGIRPSRAHEIQDEEAARRASGHSVNRNP